MSPRALLLALVLAGACAPMPVTVRPDDMSAEAHRREAARERLLAERDLDRAAPRPDRSSGPPVVAPAEDRARLAADRHRLHAEEHEQAAAALEADEDAACHDVPRTERVACPFLLLEAFAPLSDGVRLRFESAQAAAEALPRMRCHLAFARTRAFTGVRDCPLYLRGVRIERGPDARTIDLRADDSGVARELRELAALLASP